MNNYDSKPELDAHPVLPVERMTGADMSEPLAWLTARMVDSLVIDGHNFTSVAHRSEERDGYVQVVCKADDNTGLLLRYDPTDRLEPVTRIILPKES